MVAYSRAWLCRAAARSAHALRGGLRTAVPTWSLPTKALESLSSQLHQFKRPDLEPVLSTLGLQSFCLPLMRRLSRPLVKRSLPTHAWVWELQSGPARWRRCLACVWQQWLPASWPLIQPHRTLPAWRRKPGPMPHLNLENNDRESPITVFINYKNPQKQKFCWARGGRRQGIPVSEN